MSLIENLNPLNYRPHQSDIWGERERCFCEALYPALCGIEARGIAAIDCEYLSRVLSPSFEFIDIGFRLGKYAALAEGEAANLRRLIEGIPGFRAGDECRDELQIHPVEYVMGGIVESLKKAGVEIEHFPAGGMIERVKHGPLAPTVLA